MQFFSENTTCVSEAKELIYADSGEVKVCKGGGTLKAGAIGSCVIVVVYDPESGTGGMAHVMLPGASRQGLSRNTKYAEDAIEVLLEKLERCGCNRDRMIICLVGGGNMLGAGNEDLGISVVRSIADILRENGLSPIAVDVGGSQRRSCTLDTRRGQIMYTVGNSRQMCLWELEKSSQP